MNETGYCHNLSWSGTGVQQKRLSPNASLGHSFGWTVQTSCCFLHSFVKVKSSFSSRSAGHQTPIRFPLENIVGCWLSYVLNEGEHCDFVLFQDFGFFYQPTGVELSTWENHAQILFAQLSRHRPTAVAVTSQCIFQFVVPFLQQFHFKFAFRWARGFADTCWSGPYRKDKRVSKARAGELRQGPTKLFALPMKMKKLLEVALPFAGWHWERKPDGMAFCDASGWVGGNQSRVANPAQNCAHKAFI